MANCGKCNSIVRRNNGNWMACDGFCSKMFHADCVSISESDLMTCLLRNIMWFCDECLPKLWQIRNRKAEDSFPEHTIESDDSPDIKMTVEAQLVKLNADIATINETLQNVISRSTSRGGRSDANQNSTSQQTKSDLMCGTKDSSPSFLHCSTSSPSRSMSGHFWMYFTRISNLSTEDDMLNLVREALHYDGRIIVRKLVPPWIDATTLDYVSYKIGIVNDLKEKAMDSSTWPKGLRFREFVNSQHSIWEPPALSN